MYRERDMEFYFPCLLPAHFQSDKEISSAMDKRIFFAGLVHAKNKTYFFAQKLFLQLLSLAEAVTGPLFLFAPSVQRIPGRQKKIIEYLKEKGLIAESKVFFATPYNDAPKPYVCGLVPFLDSFASDVDPSKLQQNLGTGVSFNFDRAVAKGVSEFLERYFLAFFRYGDFIRTSQSSLMAAGKNALDTGQLAGFLAEQKEGKAKLVFDEDTQFLWSTGKTFPEKKDIYIPAQIIFWGYSTYVFDEPFLREANTAGAAAAFTQEEALLYGLRDLIERDTFLIYWLNTITPSRVDLLSIHDSELVAILEKLCRYQFAVEILYMPSDLPIPVFVAILLDGTGHQRSTYIGVGCDSKPERAIIHAIEEAMGIYMWQRRTGSNVFSLPESYRPFASKGAGANDRKRLWANPDSFPRIEWFLKGSFVTFDEIQKHFPTFRDTDEELTFIAEKIRSHGKGYEIYYHEVNHAILKDTGYHVLKVVIPALIPLYLRGETNIPLGAERLHTVPALLGYTHVTFPQQFPHAIP